MNVILSTDSYKASHFEQYPADMAGMFSYVESRGGQYDHTVFFGLKYILQHYLDNPITLGDVVEAAEFFKLHGEPFPVEGWMKVINEYDGYIPITIRAVAEGSVVPTHNVLMTVECTDPDLFWLVSWFETLLMRVWYPITVATQSMYCKKVILEALEKTSDDPAGEISFKLHDFGARGVSSGESAAIGGMGHLVNFLGSDTVEGVYMANKVYGVEGGMAAFSIPAMEHSTVTAWGRDGEHDAYSNMLNKFAKPGAILAAVSDSYDLWNVLENEWGDALKEQIIASGATLVIRPDSGRPRDVVLQCLQILDEKFGHTVNSKGYRVLNHVRVIQGDGITSESLPDIIDNFVAAGYSASNVNFGMGGGLLQMVNRDTQRMAYKCSAVFRSGCWEGVNKDPITDPGKASKAGRLSLYKGPEGYFTDVYPRPWADRVINCLEVVYDRYGIVSEITFDKVRENAAAGLAELMS